MPKLSIKITNPPAESTVFGTVLITYTKSGPVKNIIFTVNGQIVSQQWNTKAFPDGPFTLVASGTNGGETVKDTVTGTIKQQTQPPPDTTAPTVVITSPTPDQKILVGDTVQVSATVTDVGGGVTAADVSVDDVAISSVLQGQTVTATWQATEGAHTIRVNAYDAAKNKGTASVAIVVEAPQLPDTTPPVVQITAPTANQTLIEGSVAIVAAVMDDKEMASVRIFVDDQPQGPIMLQPPYQVDWTASPGAHTIRVEGADAAGNVGKAWLSVTVYAIPTIPTEGRLQKEDLVYAGALRLPWIDYREYGTNFSSGAKAMGFNPSRQSLILSVDDGNNQMQEFFGEVGLVEPAMADTIPELPVASLLTPPSRMFAGKLQAGLTGSSGRVPRGMLVDGDRLIIGAYINYDAGYQGSHSHFVRSADLTNLQCSDPIEILSFGPDSATNGGCAGGWQTNIPVAWREKLGGDTLAGNWDTSINSRISWGPCAIIYTRGDLQTLRKQFRTLPRSDAEVKTGEPPKMVREVATSVPGKVALFYYSPHPTLGTPMETNARWNDVGIASGVVFVEGTNTILYFTTHTNNPCYGVATQDPALHQQPVPGVPGEIYCLDYENTGGKGQHGDPYTQRVYAYDAHDLADVIAGLKEPWDPEPYAQWEFEFPQFQMTHWIRSAAYDPTTQRIYLASQYGEQVGPYYNAPLIHVLKVNVPMK